MAVLYLLGYNQPVIHTDHLGSTRLVSGMEQSQIPNGGFEQGMTKWLPDAGPSIVTNATRVQNLDYLPFGEINSTDPGISTHKFTGRVSGFALANPAIKNERDSETSLDHTWFRQYSSQFGRWMTPDPAGLAAVDPSNPQSWNRYSYVNDDPMDFIDPWGLYWACVETPNGPGGGSVKQCTWYPDEDTTGYPLASHFPDAGAGGGAEAFTCTGFVHLNCGPSGPPPLNIKSLKAAAVVNALKRSYAACAQNAATNRDATITAARVEQAVGGVSIELAIFANAQAIPALNNVFIKPLSGDDPVEAARALFDLAHAGGYAYAGTLATFIPGYLYIRGTIDVAKAWDQYNEDLVHCGNAVQVP